jgi:hypothetical protein
VEDGSLFVIDRSGDAVKREKRMKIDEILEPWSKVPSVSGKVRGNKKSGDVDKITSKVKHLQQGGELGRKRKRIVGITDVWANDVPLQEGWVEKKKAVSRPHTLQAPPKPNGSMAAPAYSADELNYLHSGESYNPSREAHEALVKMVVHKELSKTSAKAHELEKLGREIKAVDFLRDPDDMLGESESEESEASVENVRVKKAPARKTTVQRNKEKKRTQERIEEKRKLEEKNKLKQLETFAKLSSVEQPTRKRHKVRRVGPHKMETLIPDVQLPEDITDNLRNLVVCLIP